MHELLHPRMRIQHNNSLVTPIDFVIVSRSPSRSKMASFSVEAMVRGYHVYQDIWTAVIGEEFPCKREAGNTFDPFAVAVTRGDTNIVIGHVPRRISTVCSLFLRKEGSITCQVTGHRRFSEDLVQGGLEIPCVLRFDGDTKVTAKAKKLVEAALSTSTAVCCPASKKRKVTDVPSILPDTGKDASSEEWVRFGKGLILTLADKEHILAGGKLDDRHIDVAQNLLKQQFSEVGGLQSTLLQAKPRKRCEENKKMIQIVHSRGDHWIVTAMVLSTDDRVLVYDSLYRTLDRPTENIISNLFPTATIKELVQVNRQTGGLDCGVFAVAISTALAFQQNPAMIKFDQPAMRPHLVACFEKRQFSPFPSV